MKKKSKTIALCVAGQHGPLVLSPTFANTNIWMEFKRHRVRLLVNFPEPPTNVAGVDQHGRVWVFR